jgi:hypothetical protein
MQVFLSMAVRWDTSLLLPTLAVRRLSLPLAPRLLLGASAMHILALSLRGSWGPRDLLAISPDSDFKRISFAVCSRTQSVTILTD